MVGEVPSVKEGEGAANDWGGGWDAGQGAAIVKGGRESRGGGRGAIRKGGDGVTCDGGGGGCPW